MIDQHAFLAPSAAGRWGPDGCAASATAEAKYPQDTESPEAREGTAAHHFLTETLLGRVVKVGDLAPNGHPIDSDMVDCAYDVIRDVQDTHKAWSGSFGPNEGFSIERRVSAAAVVHPKNWGTPDIFLVVRSVRKLFVWDYKYGHRYVDAFRNWQCVNYAAAILETEGVPRDEWPLWTIVVTIAQPRNYHPDGPMREWHFNGAQLSELVTRLSAAAVLADTPGAAFTTGEHCRDCRARHACPALQRVAMGFVDMSLTGQPIDLPPAALGLELAIIRAAMKRLGARATGLEEQALSLARKGTSIPHWRAEYSYGRERWKEGTNVAELAALGAIYDVEMLKPPAAITPTQARKAGVDPDLIKTYSDTPRGAMALVPYTETDVAKRFG
jgi:hypothetical protein